MAAMQQIADWLQKLGLGQYAQRFAENDINFAILPDLTDQDLKELGVASLGHRRQLLRAITELKGGETGAPKPATEYTAPVTPHDTAERRQVTVMFSDLVGSTALSARMDPEDLREVISAYQKCVAKTVGRFGGFVAKYMGDGAKLINKDIDRPDRIVIAQIVVQPLREQSALAAIIAHHKARHRSLRQITEESYHPWRFHTAWLDNDQILRRSEMSRRARS
jgi:hypothetical protein